MSSPTTQSQSLEVIRDPAQSPEDLALLNKLRRDGVRMLPKLSCLANFGRAANDPDYLAAAEAGEEWRKEQNRLSLEER